MKIEDKFQAEAHLGIQKINVQQHSVVVVSSTGDIYLDPVEQDFSKETIFIMKGSLKKPIKDTE